MYVRGPQGRRITRVGWKPNHSTMKAGPTRRPAKKMTVLAIRRRFTIGVGVSPRPKESKP